MGAQLRREALQKKKAWEGFVGRLIVIWAGCVIGLGGEGESPASMSGRMGAYILTLLIFTVPY